MPNNQPTCTITECDRATSARGFCDMHYQRWKRHGDPAKNLTTEKPQQCTVGDCGKPVAGRGLCKMHWARWRTHGDPTTVTPKGSKPQHVGCKVAECEKRHHSKGYCSTHSARFKAHGDPLVVGTRKSGRKRLATLTYEGVHKRLFYDRGKASALKCVDCGSGAQEWSYDGGCPEEQYRDFNGTPLAYSIDQTRYSPRCRPCHRRRDRSLIRGRDASGRWATTKGSLS